MSEIISQGMKAIIDGERGEGRIKDFFLGWGWLARPLNGCLDQGIDLMVEVAQGGRGTGVHFAVQCKTTGDQKLKKGHYRTVLKANTFSYLRKQRLPVFVMRPSLTGNDIYWTSLDKALVGNTPNRDGGVTVKIPVEGSFSALSQGKDIERDMQKFVAEMRRVDPTLTGFYTQRAIFEQEKSLEAVDARFDVKITAGSQGQCVNVSAKEAVSLKTILQFSDRGEALKLQEAFNYGSEGAISFSKIKMEGSPLFEQMTERGDPGVLTIASEKGEKVDIKIGAARRSGPQSDLLTMAGYFTHGIKGSELVARSPRHPLTSTLRFEKELASRGLKLMFLHQTDLWEGRLLADMDRLDRAASTLKNISDSREFFAKMVFEDDEIESDGALTEDLARDVFRASRLCAALVPLHEIAKIYMPELTIGKFSDSSSAELNVWAMARDVIQGVEVKADIPGMTLTGDFSAEAGPFFRDASLGSVWVRPFDLKVQAFGREVCEIPCELYMRGFDIHPVLVDGEVTAVELLKNDSSVMLIRRYIEGAVRGKWSIAEANSIDWDIEVIKELGGRD